MQHPDLLQKPAPFIFETKGLSKKNLPLTYQGRINLLNPFLLFLNLFFYLCIHYLPVLFLIMKTPIEHLRTLTDKFRKRANIDIEKIERMKRVAEAAKKTAAEAKAGKE